MVASEEPIRSCLGIWGGEGLGGVLVSLKGDGDSG